MLPSMKRLHPCRSVTVFAASLLLLSTIVSLGQDDPPLEDQSTPAPESPTVPSDALLGEDLTLPTETLPIGEAAIPKKDRYVIGVVRDGDSWYFDDGVRRWEQELRELAGDSYSIELKDVFNAGNNSNRVGELLRQALDDDSVDMVFAAGVVATERAARLAKTEPTKVTKPIMGGALQFSEIRTQISDTGTSAIPNYTFITSPQRVTADLELLKSLPMPTSSMF